MVPTTEILQLELNFLFETVEGESYEICRHTADPVNNGLVFLIGGTTEPYGTKYADPFVKVFDSRSRSFKTYLPVIFSFLFPVKVKSTEKPRLEERRMEAP